MRRLARLRGILPGRRLHVLGARRRQSTVRPHRDRPHPVHRLQEVLEQGPRRLLPRRLSVGRDRDGRHRRSGKRSRRDANLRAARNLPLGGAALQRCGNGIVLNAALAAEVS